MGPWLNPNVFGAQQAARAKNPDMPVAEPADYLEQIYEAERRRLEALEK